MLRPSPGTHGQAPAALKAAQSRSGPPTMKAFDKLLRIGEGKIVRRLEGIAKLVNSIEDDFVTMTY